jgi:multiple sugar transport system ATP-binding protein
VATIYVTHDQIEAMTMGDRVAVLRGGVLQQCDAPQDLYDHPVNMFVAAFIGSPAMNLYAGVLSEDRQTIRLGSQDLLIASSVGVAHPGLERYAGKELVVGIRPEHIVEATAGSPGPHEVTRLHAEVELIEALGSEILVHFRIDAARVHSDATFEDELEHDESSPESAGELGRAARADSIARLDPRIRLVVGTPITFEVDTTRIHFFDGITGASIWQ